MLLWDTTAVTRKHGVTGYIVWLTLYCVGRLLSSHILYTYTVPITSDNIAVFTYTHPVLGSNMLISQPLCFIMSIHVPHSDKHVMTHKIKGKVFLLKII